MRDTLSQRSFAGLLGAVVLFTAGCTTTGGNAGKIVPYATPPVEAEWIRNGEPIKFEGRLWRPQDSIDILTDDEVYLVGEHEGVQFFVARTDVKPYDRLYTKFGHNKFRIFRKISNDDKSQQAREEL